MYAKPCPCHTYLLTPANACMYVTLLMHIIIVLTLLITYVILNHTCRHCKLPHVHTYTIPLLKNVHVCYPRSCIDIILPRSMMIPCAMLMHVGGDSSVCFLSIYVAHSSRATDIKLQFYAHSTTKSLLFRNQSVQNLTNAKKMMNLLLN